MMSYRDEDTLDDLRRSAEVDPVEAEAYFERGVEMAAMTHRGRVRQSNEDQYCLVRRVRTGEVLGTSLRDDERGKTEDHSVLLTVADGVGGQVSGEVASATVIRTILDLSNRLGTWVMRPAYGLRDDAPERVELYAEAIRRELQLQAEFNPALVGMATTVTAAYLFGANATVVNVGDSRSYLVRAGEIHQITNDHTLACELQASGLSSDVTRPYRNVLTRCFSTNADAVSFDLFQLKLLPGDRILLCSDGLSDMVKDDVICRMIDDSSSCKEACERLVTEALNNGGRDNVTVVLARVDF